VEWAARSRHAARPVAAPRRRRRAKDPFTPTRDGTAQGAVGQTTLPASPSARLENTTLEGEVVRVTYENAESGFRVLRVEVPGQPQHEVVVGVFPVASPGMRIRATGRYEQDRSHGVQFRADTVLTVAPETLGGLERYLGSGVIPGIGPAYAKRIVEAFGESTLDVLDRSPQRLREIQGLGARRIDALGRAWASHRAVGAIMIFLQAHGASPALAARIHKRFGARAMDVVARHPYRLALDVWGVGFKTADRIARSLGIARDAPERAQAGVLQTLHDLTARGHVYDLRSDLVARSAAILEIEEGLVDQAIAALALSGHVVLEATGEGEGVFPRELHEAEQRVAERFLSIVRGARRGRSLTSLAAQVMDGFERRVKVALAPAQRRAIEEAATHEALVVTGGPGVGKTTIVRAILALFDAAKLNVRLAAPTGRAAKRMTEATGREAVTLHRLLEVDPRSKTFARNRDNPLEATAIVVDEASMLDLSLADALLAATPAGARLVLVGDVDQLPSVGPGAVLRDIIDSGVVPTIRLTQIFRQAAGSLIVENAHRIQEGKMPESARSKDGEFYVFERTTPESAADLIQELVLKRIPKGFGLDPVRDVQVLTPMHRGGAGAIALNALLQSALNPSGVSVTRGSRTLRVGDKVMQLRNDYDREVYNGDVGRIRAIDEEARTVTVELDGRDVIYEEGDLDELTLAYATSIHKSQGSEYPAVIVPVLTQHFVMLSRNLVYTAVTRGKRLVILVTDSRAMALALAETRKEQRRTLLATRLRQAG